MNNKFHFVRIADKFNPKINKWYLKPDSLEALLEHWNRYGGGEMKEGIQQITERIKYRSAGRIAPHFTSYWGSLVEMTAEMKNISLLESACQLENKLFNDRLNMFLKGEEFYLTEGLTVFKLLDCVAEIVEEVYKDEMIYPDNNTHSIENVRYLQWEGGKHWYAKVGKIDIVDKEGNQKWNSKEEAERAVKEYFNN